MHVRLATALFAAVAAFAVTGCTASTTDDSSEDFKGAQRDVAKVIEELEDAANDRQPDASKICEQLFAATLARKISGRDRENNCADTLQEALDDVAIGGPTGTELEVQKITIKGSDATARVKNGDGDDELTSDYKLVKGRGGWRITGF